jgi:hypothetical protein
LLVGRCAFDAVALPAQRREVMIAAPVAWIDRMWIAGEAWAHVTVDGAVLGDGLA